MDPTTIIAIVLKFLPFLESIIKDITDIFHKTPTPPPTGFLAQAEKGTAAAASKLLRDLADALDALAK